MRNLDLALYTMQIWREAATNENKILKILASRDTMVDDADWNPIGGPKPCNLNKLRVLTNG